MKSEDERKKYDENARNVAKRKCFIIYLVVAYILYQSYGIIQSKLQNETTMSWAGAIVGAGILVVGSLAVAVIATLRMGRELAASEITEETVEADNPETNEEDIDQNPQINEEDTDQNSQSNEGNVVQNPENE